MLSRLVSVNFWLIFKFIFNSVSANTWLSSSCLSIFAENTVWYLNFYWCIYLAWVTDNSFMISLIYRNSIPNSG